jgi:competence protein ComEA
MSQEPSNVTDAAPLQGASDEQRRNEAKPLLQQRNRELLIFILVIGVWVAVQTWYSHTTPSKIATQGQAFVIDVNTATEAELKLLPGVGEKLARDILEFRETHGTIRSLNELTRIRGIKQGRLESLRKYLTIAAGQSDP